MTHCTYGACIDTVLLGFVSSLDLFNLACGRCAEGSSQCMPFPRRHRRRTSGSRRRSACLFPAMSAESYLESQSLPPLCVSQIVAFLRNAHAGHNELYLVQGLRHLRQSPKQPVSAATERIRIAQVRSGPRNSSLLPVPATSCATFWKASDTLLLTTTISCY